MLNKLTGTGNVGNLASITEPVSLEEVLASSDAKQWQRAMRRGHPYKTWTLEVRPGIRPIPIKWVFKTKRGSIGIMCYKARLAA